MTLQAYCCQTCGHTLFPARLLCPACGGASWTRVPCENGRIAESTVVRARVGVQAEGGGDDNTTLASVETDLGPIVIALIYPDEWPERVSPIGATVRLVMDDTCRIHAHRTA
jgi:uncharacterized OB-fold protein